VQLKTNNMNKIELKHLAPYSPYGLKVQHTEYIEFGKSVQRTCELSGIFTDCCTFINGSDWYFNTEENDCDIKPILRNLSDLTKEIEVNGEKFVPNHDSDFKYFIVHELDEFIESIPNSLNYSQLLKLIEWHFDVFGLIEQGLAIDVNTIKSK